LYITHVKAIKIGNFFIEKQHLYVKKLYI